MKILSNILNPVDKDTTEYLDNHILEIEEGKILDIYPLSKKTIKGDCKDFSKSILLPGLIDAHTHLPQLPITGKYGFELMDWLNNYALPAEIEFGNVNYAKKLSKNFFEKLRKYGTTTAVVYSTIHKESTDIAFQEAERADIRVFMGKTMMDQNCPSELCENTEQSIVESKELYNKWHREDEKITYIYSPRFAITSSEKLMQEVGKISKMNKVFLQTHMNENLEEKEHLRKIYPEYKTYAEIYHKCGLLGARTLLAHCIHNTEEELEILTKTNTKVIHCPDANLFLNSGTFPLRKILDYDIPIGLGSDVGAGTTLDMLEIMKSMIYGQKILIPPSTPFYYATLGNAQILDIDGIVGSIERDKQSEILKIDVDKKFKNAQEALNHIIFSRNFKRELIS
jgi:guanine deaminase